MDCQSISLINIFLKLNVKNKSLFTKDNSKLVSSDNIHFQLVATRSISKNEEITTDYNITNTKFPFIHAASDLYENC